MNGSRSFVRSLQGRAVLRRVAVTVPLVLSLALLLLGLYLMARPRKAVDYRLSMLTDLEPNRRRLAERIAAEAAKLGMEVTLSTHSYGALEELALVNADNNIDVALVPGGVGKGQFGQTRQVTALGVEPLHLLVKPDLFAEASKSLKMALRGKRVNIGPVTTDSHVLGRDLLRFVGLDPRTDNSNGRKPAVDSYHAETLAPQELSDRSRKLRHASATVRAECFDSLPDAIILVAPMPSEVVRNLVRNAGYRLVSLPFTDAYSLDRLDPDQTDGDKGGEDMADERLEEKAAGLAAPVRIDRAAMTTTEIPPFTYGIDPPVPEKPCRTIGTRLLLISYAPTGREAVARLLEVVFETPVHSLARPPALTEQLPQFEPHSGVEFYLRSKRPYLTPELMSQLGKFLGGAGAFASGLVAFYGFLKLRQLRRFEAYYQEIRRIELIARGLEDDPSAPSTDHPSDRMAYLELRLNDLKCEAVKDFADGGLKGEGLMSGIAALVNDTRDSLGRIAARNGS